MRLQPSSSDGTPRKYQGMARSTSSPGDIAGIVFAVALFLLFAVMPPVQPTEAAPAAPVINFMMASRTTVFTTQSCEVYCVAQHEDELPLTYLWSSSAGSVMPSGDSAVWFAPDEPGTYLIVVQVLDEAGQATTDNLTIEAVKNKAPIVSSVTAEPSLLLPGQSATLTCNAEDLEGHSISYEWLSSTGDIDGLGSSVTWTAPAQPGSHYVVVRATDELGETRTRNVMVTVQCPEPPVITELAVWPTLPDYTKEDIRGGFRLLRGSLTSCELECFVELPYGEATYEWTCTEGTIEGRGPIVLYVPPNATAEALVTVTVSDVCGNSAQAEVLFRVFQREEYSNEILSNEGGCLRCLYGY